MATTIEMSRTMSDADICRELGWKVGTRIVGDEGYGPTTIEITAVGQRSVLASCVREDGTLDGVETSWTLSCREWTAVLPEPAAEHEHEHEHDDDEQDDDEIGEVTAYTVYKWDCECGYDNALEHDPASEIVECDDCGLKSRVESTR